RSPTHLNSSLSPHLHARNIHTIRSVTVSFRTFTNLSSRLLTFSETLSRPAVTAGRFYRRVRDVNHLPQVAGRDGQPEGGCRVRQRAGRQFVQLAGRIRPPDRALPVFGVDRTQKGRQEAAKQRQGQRMPDQVEQNESAAKTADVADQIDQPRVA